MVEEEEGGMEYGITKDRKGLQRRRTRKGDDVKELVPP